MRILIYGSSYLTELCEAALMDEGHTIVGHIPCRAPAFPGQMRSKVVTEDEPCDIRLSILYDRRITRIENGYNVHPGLLPRWGGCDILYHTIRERAVTQGMTFHMLDEGFDTGRILRTSSFMVPPDATISGLYHIMCKQMPTFTVWSVNNLCGHGEPHYYKRGEIDDPVLYARGGDEIREYIRRRRELQSRS
jgi:formyl transferase-like protein